MPVPNPCLDVEMMEPGVGPMEPMLGQPEPIHPPNSLGDRLQKLKEAEQNLNKAVTATCNYLAEVSKDKVPGPKTLDPLRNSFSENVKNVDRALLAQIHLLSQVSVGTSHEGSVYSAVATKKMATERLSDIDAQLTALGDSIPTF